MEKQAPATKFIVYPDQALDLTGGRLSYGEGYVQQCRQPENTRDL